MEEASTSTSSSPVPGAVGTPTRTARQASHLSGLTLGRVDSNSSPVATVKQMMQELMAELGRLRQQQDAIVQQLEERKRGEEEHNAWWGWRPCVHCKCQSAGPATTCHEVVVWCAVNTVCAYTQCAVQLCWSILSQRIVGTRACNTGPHATALPQACERKREMHACT